jgi:transposase
MPKLSDAEIKQRLVRLTNLERLHTQDQQTKSALRDEVKQLKTALAELKALFLETTERQQARIEELETMVFGRKPKGDKPIPSGTAKPKTPRTTSSYRRPLPPAHAITGEERHPITDCHRCGHELTDKDEATRYEEDIVLAALSPDVPHKTVTKHTVERGWCSQCGQWSSAKDLRGQVVTLGPVVRSLIVYLVIQADQTYAQARDLLWQLYRFPVTEGEITTILNARRLAYLPTYETLKESVRAGPAHLDETRYPIQSEQGAGYAHVMVSGKPAGTPGSTDVAFKLADSRGKGNSKALVGKNYQDIGITDRYGSYKDLFEDGKHQICWAHLQRTARDLTRLECLSRRKLKHVTRFYHQLAAVYAAIRTHKDESFDAAKRQTQADALLEQTRQLCTPHTRDPKKLADLKAGILEYQDRLFLCLTVDGIPADNNKAERALRKLVIKRKKSLSVKTPKGARTLEVLLSVCQSLYNRDQNNFLPALHALATAKQ